VRHGVTDVANHGRPLKQRLNIVLSRQSKLSHKKARCLARLRNPCSRLTSIGRRIYLSLWGQDLQDVLGVIEKWIVTEVPLVVEGADAFMPDDYLEGFESVGSKNSMISYL